MALLLDSRTLLKKGVDGSGGDRATIPFLNYLCFKT
jgi:hypothetical protein